MSNRMRDRWLSFTWKRNMLISHKHKFIFIHIPKTAGTTMRALLEPVVDDFTNFLNDEGKKILSKRIAIGLNPSPIHMNIIGVSRILDVRLEEYTLVTAIRDPFDRFVSYYNYLKFNNPSHRLHPAANKLTLNQFVPFLINDKEFDTACQYSFIRRDNKILMKNVYILKTEQLEEDYKKFCEIFQLPVFPIKSLNKSEGRTEENLTLDSKILIHNFERDIEIIYRS